MRTRNIVGIFITIVGVFIANSVFAKSVLRSGEILSVNQTLNSPNRLFFAVMQNDGNFVVYRGSGPSDVRYDQWATKTNQSSISKFFAAMQADGNFVVYRGTSFSDNRGAVWSSQTNTTPGSFFLSMQDDGNLVIYKGKPEQPGSATWNTGAHSGLLGLEQIAEDQAMKYAPVFDFDGDSCFAAPAISFSGKINGGLKIGGSITGGCRDMKSDLKEANTYYRGQCLKKDGNTFCGHVYALYFEKDQTNQGALGLAGFGGHRHDWEYVVIWTKNGVMTHASASAHGDLTTKKRADLDAVNGDHVKIVYHSDDGGFNTHAFRFSKSNETAENALGWHTPRIVDWSTMRGLVDNHALRRNLSDYDFGSASFPLKNDKFAIWLTDANLTKDSGGNYPLKIRGRIPEGYPDANFWFEAVDKPL